MGIILWIVFGGLVGWIASMFMGTNAQQGLILNVIVGVVGALLGGWIMSAFNGSGVTGFNFYSFLVALLGSCILLALLKLFRK